MKERHTQGAAMSPMTVEDQLAQMRDGKKAIFEIRLGNAVFPVRVLSADEVAAVRREAIRKAALANGDDTDRNLEIQKTTLKLASTVTKGGAPTISDKLLSMMFLDELTFLYDEYIRIMDSVNPALDQITPEKFTEIVGALKKSLVSPRDLSLLQLRAICLAYLDSIQRQESRT